MKRYRMLTNPKARPMVPMKRMEPIPPNSVVRLARSDAKTPWYKDQVGRVFRIGYYGRNDGLDCIWLVNDDGKYEQTVDHDYLYRYFDVLHFAHDTNWYGRMRPLMPPILRAGEAVKQKKRIRR